MGYACPVCETPQRDGEHLAHHLAFTAMLHGDDHEAWLHEHVPDWGNRDPEGLASTVVEDADETEYHEVFEDTVNDRGRPDVGGYTHDGGHTHDSGHTHDVEVSRRQKPGHVDAETQAVLEEARALTRQLRGESDGDAEAEAGSGGNAEAEAGSDGDAGDDSQD